LLSRRAFDSFGVRESGKGLVHKVQTVRE